MARMQKTPLLALVAILALIGLCLVGVADEGNALNLPDALPDGSTLVSVKDVFMEVADAETAWQLRSHMPHVLGGTEYRYVLEKDGQVESEWGIVVFEFKNEQVALGDFQHLANEVAFVNKNPRFVRIEGAANVPEIQAFLDSDLEYACLMNEIVIFPMGTRIVWVDDYQRALAVEESANYGRPITSAIRIAEQIGRVSRGVEPEVESLGASTGTKRSGWPLRNHDVANSRSSASGVPVEIAVHWSQSAPGGLLFPSPSGCAPPLIASNSCCSLKTGISPSELLKLGFTFFADLPDLPLPPVGGVVYCRDIENAGELTWPKPRAFYGASGKLALDTEGDRVILGVEGLGQYLFNGYTKAVSLKDGSTVWEHSAPAPTSRAEYAVADGDLLYGAHKYKVAVDQSYSHYGLISVNADTGEENWFFKTPVQDGGDVIGSPAVHEGHIYFVTCSTLYCVKETDDQVAPVSLEWSVPLGGNWVSGCASAPVVDGDKAYLVAKRQLHCVDLREHKVLWSTDPIGMHPSYSHAPLALADGVLYTVRSEKCPSSLLPFREDVLYALTNLGEQEPVDSDVKWKYGKCEGLSLSSPVVTGNAVVVVAGNPPSRVLAIDVTDGSLLWAKELGSGPIIGGARPAGGRVFVGSTSGDACLGAPLVDLRALSVSWNPQLPISGDHVTFTVVIENVGSSEAAASLVCVSVNGSIVTVQQADAIDSNGTTTATFPDVWMATPGTHTFKVEVDYNDEIAESNESNNILSKVLEVEEFQPELPPTGTILIMDVSSSMGWDWKGGVKIESAKKAALNFIEHVAREAENRGTDHRIAIVAFSTTAQILLPLTSNYEKARKTVISLDPVAATNIGDGLIKGLQELQKLEKDSQRFMILLSDGVSNRGLSSQRILSGPVARARQQGICIHTVGFGDPGDIDQAFLRRIATESGCGTYGYAETPTQLFYTYVRARHTALGNIMAEFSAIDERVVMIPDLPSALGTVILLGEEREMHYTLAWSEEGAISAQLRDPSGRVFDSSVPGVVSYSGETFSYVMVPSPARGVWTVEAVPAFAVPEETEYYAVVSTRPGGSAIALPLPTFRIGEWTFTLPAGLPAWLLIAISIAGFFFYLYQQSS